MFRVFPGLSPLVYAVASQVFRAMCAVQERLHVLGDVSFGRLPIRFASESHHQGPLSFIPVPT